MCHSSNEEDEESGRIPFFIFTVIPDYIFKRRIMNEKETANRIVNWFLAWSQYKQVTLSINDVKKLLNINISYIHKCMTLKVSDYYILSEVLSLKENTSLTEGFDFNIFSKEENEHLIKVWNTFISGKGNDENAQ